MDYERLAVLVIFWALGLAFVAWGRSLRRRKLRLRERGVEVDAVRTGRDRSVGEGGGTEYEVRFTVRGGETMTAWISDRLDDRSVIYDPEQPPVRKRLGPFRYMRHAPMARSYVKPKGAFVEAWILIGFGLAIGVFGMVMAAAVPVR